MGPVEYIIDVTTGDRKNAGTDANVRIILHDDRGGQTKEALLDRWFHDDLERGRVDNFTVQDESDLDTIAKIELWRDTFGVSDDWFLDWIVVKRKDGEKEFNFPVFRWIQPEHHYMFRENDTVLPQHDSELEQRKMGLDRKMAHYEMIQKVEGIQMQVKTLPDDESFSFDYKWDLLKRKYTLIGTSKILKWTTGKWESLEDLKNIYTTDVFGKPESIDVWQTDEYFGWQRLTRLNHSLITLCKSIPDKLGVTDEMLRPMLWGYSLQEVMDANRLFIVDLHLLDELPIREGFKLCAPIALFFLNGRKELRPIAIQLFQQKSPDNPVFLPSDPEYTWLMAKMWFNNADSTHHQALAHLGFTHLLMEGVTCVSHRNLSMSHPLFKLMAPHFLYLLAINSRAIEVLVAPGGWIDTTMTSGIVGLFELNRRGVNSWRMDVHGTLPEELKSRGLLDSNILPCYYFRDDALLLYRAINNYVKKYVDLYYDSSDKIREDWELQNWGSELVKPREQGGAGLLGVPGNGTFTTKEEMYVTFTSIIYTCSVAHAATNFPQYDEYGFPPNYPSCLFGSPPKDKRPLKEEDVVSALPDKATTLDTMTITKILSNKGTNSLGDFEVQYIADPPAKKIVEEFRAELAEISSEIKKRNKTRDHPYTVLDPEFVPNSISI